MPVATELALELERVNLERRHVLQRLTYLDERAALLRKQIQMLERAEKSPAPKSSVRPAVHPQSVPTLPPDARRVLRRGDLKAATGLSPSSIYRLIKEGKFPAAVPLGAKAVGWLRTDVENWLSQQQQRRA